MLESPKVIDHRLSFTYAEGATEYVDCTTLLTKSVAFTNASVFEMGTWSFFRLIELNNKLIHDHSDQWGSAGQTRYRKTCGRHGRVERLYGPDSAQQMRDTGKGKELERWCAIFFSSLHFFAADRLSRPGLMLWEVCAGQPLLPRVSLT